MSQQERVDRAIAIYQRGEVTLAQAAAEAGVAYDVAFEECVLRRVVLIEDPDALAHLSALGRKLDLPTLTEAAEEVQRALAAYRDARKDPEHQAVVRALDDSAEADEKKRGAPAPRADGATARCEPILVMYGGSLSAAIRECMTHRYPGGGRMLIGSPDHLPFETADASSDEGPKLGRRPQARARKKRR